LYFFVEDVRDKMAEEVSTVAKLSLDDESLLSKTEQLSRDIVYNLLHDSSLKEKSVDFVKGFVALLYYYGTMSVETLKKWT